MDEAPPPGVVEEPATPENPENNDENQNSEEKNEGKFRFDIQ